MRRATAALLLLLWCAPCPALADEQKLASPDEVREAVAVFTDWANAYIAGDYSRQWRLTDPRIRHWKTENRWHKAMRKAVRRDGVLTTVDIRSAGPMPGDKLPCTEMRHCYPTDLTAVVLILDTSYAHAAVKQPEFMVMVQGEEGWRVGGGNFPNRPFGESMVILNSIDERRYQPGRTP
ncbi:MAG: hypothetical protein EP335_13680 [Alphaproteobacteria bacterium]|nr:MAG: hypothetical protein EP335_13680 [Alphaproteobacteria bacterium]